MAARAHAARPTARRAAFEPLVKYAIGARLMFSPIPIEVASRSIRNLFVVVSLGMFVAGCEASKPARPICPPGERCVQLGNAAEPVSLDPHKTSGTWEDRIISDAIVGLTQDSPDGGTIPGMAERWETSPDGLVWTFHLREAVWSDGVPVTADDFVYSFQRILSPKLASQYAYLLYFIKNAEAVNKGSVPADALGARAIDPRTLELRLEHPAPYLPEIAKHTAMFPVPKHAVQKWGDAWSQAEHYVGNGPYNIVAWRLGDYVKAVKNPRFYDAANVCFDQVYYYPTTDAISAERRVARGELDANSDIQSNRIAFLRQKMPGYVRTHTYVGVAYLAFNAHVPAFKDRRVRIALDMAVDREFITGKLLRGGQLPAYTFVPPGVANYDTPAKPPVWAAWPFERRIAAAKVLMAHAGDGPRNPLQIEIKHRNSSDPMLFMPAIQQDWNSIGVQTSLAQNDTQIAYQSYRMRGLEGADAAWIAEFNEAS